MTVDIGSALAAGGWAMFWIQLPVLVVGVAAICRAKREDIPAVFTAFTTAFGRRRTSARHRTSAEQGPGTQKEDDR